MRQLLLLLLLGVLARLLLLIWGNYQDNCLAVPYTDIDYYVFTDAAKLISQGLSPYTHPTFRLSPFLALLLLPTVKWQSIGKVFFCVADCLCLLFIIKIKKQTFSSIFSVFQLALFFLNPIIINVSTRGNSDSFTCLLLLLFIHQFSHKNIVLAAIIYGFLIHWRLFPIIFGFSILIYLYKHYSSFSLFVKFKLIFKFFSISMISFISILVFSEYFFPGYVSSGLIYHFNRVDFRHNFSGYWYFNYLVENLFSHSHATLSRIANIFRLICHFFISFKNHNDLIKSFYYHSVLFIFLNSVYTVQYFSWFICFFPLIVNQIKFSRKFIFSLVLWFSLLFSWLFTAFLIEFKGFNLFFLLSIFSQVFSLYSLYFFLNI
ncbi:hypothetical protein RCL1_006891 [Eukaryota sp. TZLM3-RCL]